MGVISDTENTLGPGADTYLLQLAMTDPRLEGQLKSLLFLLVIMTVLAQAPTAIGNTWNGISGVVNKCTQPDSEVIY